MYLFCNTVFILYYSYSRCFWKLSAVSTYTNLATSKSCKSFEGDAKFFWHYHARTRTICMRFVNNTRILCPRDATIFERDDLVLFRKTNFLRNTNRDQGVYVGFQFSEIWRVSSSLGLFCPLQDILCLPQIILFCCVSGSLELITDDFLYIIGPSRRVFLYGAYRFVVSTLTIF